MMFASPLIRSLVVSAGLLVAGSSALAAGLTIPAAGIQANSVLDFSDAALKSFNLRFIGVSIEAKGNASVIDQALGTYNMPITSISVSSSLKVSGGQAKGSALLITRANDDDVTVGMTLANFTINYDTKQVLADATPLHGTTIPQMPLYNFNVATPLALKYRFPLSITGHEVLNKLFLTTQAKAFFMSSLALPSVAASLLETTDFGTLTQDISITARKPAVPTASYVPAR